MQQKIVDDVANATTQIGAAVATAPAVATVFSMQWWNENSAGVVALCAFAGAIISFSSFMFTQWRNGNLKKLCRTIRGKK